MIFFIFFIFLPFFLFAEAEKIINIATIEALYPMVYKASEGFGQLTKFRAPVVKYFESGNVVNTLCDVNNSFEKKYDIIFMTRQIRDYEKIKCAKIDILDIKEVNIGKIAILFVQGKNSPKIALSSDLIYKALAQNIIRDNFLIKNFYLKWSQADVRLPDIPIQIYGPSNGDVLRGIFNEFILKPECMGISDMKNFYSTYDERNIKCSTIRADGKFVEYGDSINFVIQKIKNDISIISIVSYYNFLANKENLVSIPINGVDPTIENIKNGLYPFVFNVFMYYRESTLEKESIEAFVRDVKNSDTQETSINFKRFGIIK